MKKKIGKLDLMQTYNDYEFKLVFRGSVTKYTSVTSLPPILTNYINIIIDFIT